MASDPGEALQKAAHANKHWTKEWLSGLDNEELTQMAMAYGIDPESCDSWDEVEDQLLAMHRSE